MNLEQFRINHSMLIEHYQWIEFHLEGIYAALSEKPLLYALQDVEKDSLHRIIKEIKTIEHSKNICVFTKEEYEKMERIFQRRNFWCHNCYTAMVFDRKTGGPKKSNEIKIIHSDLYEAERLSEELFSKKETLLNNKFKI